MPPAELRGCTAGSARAYPSDRSPLGLGVRPSERLDRQYRLLKGRRQALVQRLVRVLEQVPVQRRAKGGRRLVVDDRVPADGRDARGGHLVGDRDAAAAVEDDELEKGDRRE